MYVLFCEEICLDSLCNRHCHYHYYYYGNVFNEENVEKIKEILWIFLNFKVKFGKKMKQLIENIEKNDRKLRNFNKKFKKVHKNYENYEKIAEKIIHFKSHVLKLNITTSLIKPNLIHLHFVQTLQTVEGAALVSEIYDCQNWKKKKKLHNDGSRDCMAIHNDEKSIFETEAV